jgi:putative phosphoesterase
MTRLGIISDTHGLLRPEALAFLQGCDRIVHGGDIGNADILATLAALAPLTAVRGNNDTGAWAATLPETATLTVEGIRLLVLHDRQQLALAPAPAGLRVVVSGHSHKPLLEERNGVLWINPGSAGPRRFRLPVSVAELIVEGSAVQGRIVELLPLPPR